ncbi:hypothetical protein H5410_005200 [Solanum commersonii]|uniref:Uncharacterized protein n=1 Tax=Solanum commersonii TaxID=4109 RepID=A0A9J6A5R9_SOLCO|nr:hypothetical protein H5410_005200 [Solanum commersonii]
MEGTKGWIATEDNLRKMRISLASRCYCLWRFFATCAGISMKGNQLHQMIKIWCTKPTTTKLSCIYRAIPSLVMWELWKGRNNRRHEKEINFERLLQQTQLAVHRVVKVKYPWIDTPKEWEGIVLRL